MASRLCPAPGCHSPSIPTAATGLGSVISLQTDSPRKSPDHEQAETPDNSKVSVFAFGLCTSCRTTLLYFHTPITLQTRSTISSSHFKLVSRKSPKPDRLRGGHIRQSQGHRQSPEKGGLDPLNKFDTQTCRIPTRADMTLNLGMPNSIQTPLPRSASTALPKSSLPSSPMWPMSVMMAHPSRLPRISRI